MTVKTSVSISDQQDAFARRLVEEGRYSNVSAVVQRGLELLREETALKEAELAALRALTEKRSTGPFLTIAESERQIDEMIENKRITHGL
jgi:antitoxin ParD1/3/4